MKTIKIITWTDISKLKVKHVISTLHGICEDFSVCILVVFQFDVRTQTWASWRMYQTQSLLRRYPQFSPLLSFFFNFCNNIISISLIIRGMKCMKSVIFYWQTSFKKVFLQILTMLLQTTKTYSKKFCTDYLACVEKFSLIDTLFILKYSSCDPSFELWWKILGINI